MENTWNPLDLNFKGLDENMLQHEIRALTTYRDYLLTTANIDRACAIDEADFVDGIIELRLCCGFQVDLAVIIKTRQTILEALTYTMALIPKTTVTDLDEYMQLVRLKDLLLRDDDDCDEDT